MPESRELTRRDFTKAVAVAAAVPMLAPLAGCVPTTATPPAAPPVAAPPAATPAQPSPLARALADAVRAQYGERMSEAELARVQRSISGNLQAAERLRAFPLPIATEPAFVFRVAGGAAR